MIKDPITLTQQEKDQLSVRVMRAFSPHTPIDKVQMFAGRTDIVRKVLGCCLARGRHVILFGERGVGKSSMVTVLQDFLSIDINPGSEIFAPRINCTSTDNFETVWRNIFSHIDITLKDEEGADKKVLLSEHLKDTPITPFVVQKSLEDFDRNSVMVIIFDEFDAVKNDNAQKLFAETIKNLSDHSVPVTVILVGVADTVEDLIKEHQSIDRNLLLIRMLRMKRNELQEILQKALDKLNMGVEDNALNKLIILSQGLPYFIHLVGQQAAICAIEEGKRNIDLSHVQKGIEKALEETQQIIKTSYIHATSSPKDNLYEEVLLACALAEQDELGSFAPGDIRSDFRKITKNPNYDIPNYMPHFNNLSSEKRGNILTRIGREKRRYRYRFSNPLMQPYVIMRGLLDGKITDDSISSAG